MIGLPWSVKIIYGLTSDNIPICGTRRKSYIIIMGLLQFVAMISIYIFNIQNGFVVTLLLGLASLSLAFINVVVDAIIIVQSRKDSLHGSQDLMSIAWMAMGVGGVAGCVAGGYLT